MATKSPSKNSPAALVARAASDKRSGRPVVRADVHGLLCCYRDALELAADPPPSRRTPWAPLARSRMTWGLQRMVVEHIRGRIALIDRRYCLRLALGEHDANDAEDREQLSLFIASLPPPRSRLWVAVPLLAVIAVSQVLLALLLHSQHGLAKTADGRLLPEDVLKQLTAATDLNPAHLTDTLTALLHSNPKVTALTIGMLTFSVYIVMRPLLPAFRLKRMILGMPGALGPRQKRSDLGAHAQRLNVGHEEAALFAALALRPPADFALDLWVKGTLVAILGALAALMFAPPSEHGLGIFFSVLALVRLAWLVHEWDKRRRRADPVTSRVREPRR